MDKDSKVIKETYEGKTLLIGFHEVADAPEHVPIFSVIMARYEGKWLFSRHESRSTWEIPGGHIEEGETPMEAARRELYEETGALDFDMESVAVYYMDYEGQKTYGWLYYANVRELGRLPQMEIAEVRAFDQLPEELTYYIMQPYLYERVCRYLEERRASNEAPTQTSTS